MKREHESTLYVHVHWNPLRSCLRNKTIEANQDRSRVYTYWRNSSLITHCFYFRLEQLLELVNYQRNQWRIPKMQTYVWLVSNVTTDWFIIMYEYGSVNIVHAYSTVRMKSERLQNVIISRTEKLLACLMRG